MCTTVHLLKVFHKIVYTIRVYVRICFCIYIKYALTERNNELLYLICNRGRLTGSIYVLVYAEQHSVSKNNSCTSYSEHTVFYTPFLCDILAPKQWAGLMKMKHYTEI
jgi:hypothetical protein